MREAEGAEHVEPHDGPAESAQMIVDLVHEPAITAAPIGSGRAVCAPALAPPAIENDLDRGIPGKRALRVFEELLAIALDDHDLLDDLAVALPAVLGSRRPALWERMELGQNLEGTLVEELRQQNPGVSATRGA